MDEVPGGGGVGGEDMASGIAVGMSWACGGGGVGIGGCGIDVGSCCCGSCGSCVIGDSVVVAAVGAFVSAAFSLTIAAAATF